MIPDFFVAIEGPIGVGKTTLARILSDELGSQLVLEVFEENPFLSDFYADRARYAFQTQIFFLLSRYRQQHDLVERALRVDSLVSDYLFAKDRLFAHLNLAGDELMVYEHLYAALGEQVPTPSLVVYLRAGTDVLMNRIAFRDRSYERTMSRQYIDDLRIAYERFFADYTDAPVLSIETSELDFVSQPEHRQQVVRAVRAALEQGPFQPALPQVEPSLSDGGAPVMRRDRPGLGDLQRLNQQIYREHGAIPDLYLTYLGLTEHVGDLGRELKLLWMNQHERLSQALAATAGEPIHIQHQALAQARERLKGATANVLTHLLKLANEAGVDLEEAYFEHLSREPSARNER